MRCQRANDGSIGRTPCESRHSRRSWLEVGAAGAAGMFFADWFRAQAALPIQRAAGKAKSVILIFNCGAPSHTDLWDMKPAAAENIRGLFQPISTNVPGIQISELMPHLAAHADKLAIVRGVHHTHGSHNSGMYWSIVGRPYRMDSTTINPSPADYPSIGTLVGWLAKRDGYSGAVPPYVITPFPHGDSTVYVTPGQFGSCLGREYDPFVLGTDPNAPNFKVPNLDLVPGLTPERIEARDTLLGQVDPNEAWADSAGALDLDAYRRKAASLVTSPTVAKAFDLASEPDAVRDRYGRHQWGQSHLLARRLIEAGVRCVTTVNGRSIIWDTHNDNFGRLKNTLAPPMELAFATLLEDLAERGLLDTTLVVWMGDFGRTPIINAQGGRDHWPQCYSMVLAGGGIRGGQIIGASDSIGAFPASRPVTPADVHATIFKALGYDLQSITYQTVEGRPTALSDGEPIAELL